MGKNKKITVIGGGTGTVAVLRGLKKYEDLDISVIVSMTDDGGSNAIVRDEFGLLPLSDLRKSIIALAGNGNGTFRELFMYRFDKGGGLSGHTLGNLILMALSDITGSELEAIKAAGRLFHVKGKIIPVTLDDVRLVAEYDDGSIVKGEHFIDEPEEKEVTKHIARFYTEPKASPSPDAIKAILEADYIVAGPGDLFTTTLANVIIEGISEAIRETSAKFVFINNLMTKQGQTHGMKATDLIAEVEKYTTRTPDIVLVNNSPYNEKILERYAQSFEFPMEDDTNGETYKVIKADLVLDEEVEKEKGDNLTRSLIRHDSEKLADVLYNQIFKDS